MYVFPDDTDSAVERLLVDDASLAHADWALTRCAWRGPANLRTIDVEANLALSWLGPGGCLSVTKKVLLTCDDLSC